MSIQIKNMWAAALLVGLFPCFGFAATNIDIPAALAPIVEAAKSQPTPQAISVSEITCPGGQSLTSLLVTGLRDQGISALSALKRQEELASDLRAEKQSQGYPWLLTGSCLPTGKVLQLDLRLADAESGRILASYSSKPSLQEPQSNDESVSLLTQLRKLSDEVIRNLDAMNGNLRYQRFALANFAEIGQSTQDKQLGLVVSAQLQSMLQNDHNLYLVEREEVAKLVDEIQLGQMGLVSEKDAVEIGKMSGAQALILGSISEAGSQYIVNVRIVSVGEARVWASAETNLPASDLIALSSEAAVLRTRSGAIYRSLLLPGWGQFYNREPIKGAVFAGAEIAAAGLSAMFHLFGAQSQADYNALGIEAAPEQFTSLRDDASQQYKMRNIMIYTALGIHLLGIIDATLSGYSGDSSPGHSGTSPLSWSF